MPDSRTTEGAIFPRDIFPTTGPVADAIDQIQARSDGWCMVDMRDATRLRLTLSRALLNLIRAVRADERAAIAAAPSPSSGWVRVSDRLPEEHARVLVRWTTADRAVSYRTGDDWWDEQGISPHEPTHWMQLPAPPQVTP